MDVGNLARSDRPCHGRAHNLDEALLVRPPVDHEARERLAGVQGDVAALLGEGGEIEAARGQLLRDLRVMWRGGDDQAGLACAQCRADESADGIQGEGLIVVELDDMRRAIGVAPLRGRRARR